MFLSQNLQAMDERRTVKLGETYRSFAEVELKVIPIVSKCLEGMVSAAKAVDERKVCICVCGKGRTKRWVEERKENPVRLGFGQT